MSSILYVQVLCGLVMGIFIIFYPYSTNHCLDLGSCPHGRVHEKADVLTSGNYIIFCHWLINQSLKCLILSLSLSLYTWKWQVNPQFYAFRWITLLLTQEFNFADSLQIWDTLLSDPEGPQVSLCSCWFIYCAVLIAFVHVGLI